MGITAGFSPGPLMALVISETVKGGKIKGIKVALAPLFTDIPLILVIILILRHIENIDYLLGVISLIGSFFLFYFGYKDLKTNKIDVQTEGVSSRSFGKGLLTNLLNPHPYLFWFFIGVPFMIKGDTWARVMFISSFFFGIVGSKTCLAVIVDRGKRFVESKHYVRIIKFLGLVLIFFSFLLLKDATGYLLK